MTSPLSLSPEAAIRTELFGAERQPIVIVDHALADPAMVVQIAAQHEFRRIGPHYPGVRAAVSERVAMALVQPVTAMLESTFGLARSPRFLECYLSLLTLSSAELTPIQRFPHFDGVEDSRLAVLLYLDASEATGTGFYRQRATGFESVDAGRFDAYRTSLESEVAVHGLPDAGYVGGDSALFERVYRIAGCFNRMVIYRGNVLHCADIPQGFTGSDQAGTGRLTLNLFLH
ncbi:DUF6445 family protein [Blastomonas sp. AAP53]|uniref:DUF6445 family protein n=1 Tax=Blastomonas sp. AAP53 TaxID=1248760 RepID=UPI0002F88582|nr:DUF6445 family protein [Blastomonas sp. AAP53]